MDPGLSFRLYPGIYIGRPKQSTSKCFEQIAKPTRLSFYKYSALSFSTGLQSKEPTALRSTMVLQPCATHLFPGIFQPISG